MKSRSGMISGQGVGANLRHRQWGNRSYVSKVPNLRDLIASALAKGAQVTLIWLDSLYNRAIRFYTKDEVIAELQSLIAKTNSSALPKNWANFLT